MLNEKQCSESSLLVERLLAHPDVVAAVKNPDFRKRLEAIILSADPEKALERAMDDASLLQFAEHCLDASKSLSASTSDPV